MLHIKQNDRKTTRKHAPQSNLSAKQDSTNACENKSGPAQVGAPLEFPKYIRKGNYFQIFTNFSEPNYPKGYAQD